MKLKILCKYFRAIVQGWISVLSCMVVVALILLSFWAKTSTQIRISGLAAAACILVVSIGAWTKEYLRAEKAEAEKNREPRPLITVESYSAEKDDIAQSEEYLVEMLQIANRGDVPAIGITMRPLQISGRTACTFASVANLEPGQTTAIRILNLRRTLERAAEKTARSRGHALSVRLPLTIECRDFLKQQWITDHVVLFGVDGISIDVVRASKPPEWTSFSKTRGHY
jgi:hypothetical protein